MKIENNAWNGKKIFITGASGGIGLTTVVKALKNGAKVCAFYRSENEALSAINSDNLLLFKGDITSIESVNEAIKATVDCFGGIDVIINNAGVMYYMDINEPNYEQMKTMIETNCIGFINLIQAGLKNLTQSSQSHWINITSDAARCAFAGLAIYSGTKAFLEFSANAMRQELIKHKVKVTNIQPGNVATPLHNKSTEEAAISKYTTENIGQYLNPEDIANAIGYALSTPFEVAVNEILIEPLTESI